LDRIIRQHQSRRQVMATFLVVFLGDIGRVYDLVRTAPDATFVRCLNIVQFALLRFIAPSSEAPAPPHRMILLYGVYLNGAEDKSVENHLGGFTPQREMGGWEKRKKLAPAVELRGNRAHGAAPEDAGCKGDNADWR